MSHPTGVLAVLVVVLCSPTAAAAVTECESIQADHSRMLASSFEVFRTLRMSVNGELKKREVARLALEDGALATEIVEEESFSKVFVFEGEGNDPALAIEFDCRRFERLGGERYRLISEDGLESAVFERDPVTGRVAPVEWRFATVERLLFKKLEIHGEAEYSVVAPTPSP